MLLLKRLIALSVFPLAACALGPSASVDTGFGASPPIVAPHETLISMVNIAPVQGRPTGFMPTTPSGFMVTEFASTSTLPSRPGPRARSRAARRTPNRRNYLCKQFLVQPPQHFYKS